MKIIAALLVIFTTCFASAQVTGNKILNVDSVELIKGNWGRIGLGYATEGSDTSIIIVTCREKDTLEFKYPYECARMPVITKFASVGATATLDLSIVTIGRGFGIKNFNGKTLRDLFGNYYGIQAGFALFAGARTTPFLMNSNRIVAHNLMQISFNLAEFDISGLRMKVVWPKDSSFDTKLLDMELVSN